MTLVYHITHVSNLTSIIGSGGLVCDRAAGAMDREVVGLAYQHIKMRRTRTPVPKCRGGTLADYVPFYFGPRSPMLYVIHQDGIEGYTGGQTEVLHLEVDAEEVAAAGLPFAFTDGHAVMALSNFYDDLGDLSAVDMPLMKSRYWSDTDVDPDRKRRRQAEFLVHQSLPWNMIRRIGVQTQKMQQRVEGLLAGNDHIPTVVVKPGWYY